MCCASRLAAAARAANSWAWQSAAVRCAASSWASRADEDMPDGRDGARRSGDRSAAAALALRSAMRSRASWTPLGTAAGAPRVGEPSAARVVPAAEAYASAVRASAACSRSAASSCASSTASDTAGPARWSGRACGDAVSVGYASASPAPHALRLRSACAADRPISARMASTASSGRSPPATRRAQISASAWRTLTLTAAAPTVDAAAALSAWRSAAAMAASAASGDRESPGGASVVRSKRAVRATAPAAMTSSVSAGEGGADGGGAIAIMARMDDGAETVVGGGACGEGGEGGWVGWVRAGGVRWSTPLPQRNVPRPEAAAPAPAG